MGGLGSGRDGYRLVVENGLKLDSYRMQKQGLLNIHESGRIIGRIEWTYTSTGEYVASIGYSVNYENRTIVLDYTKTKDGKTISVSDVIQLTIQRTNFGGSRFLFLCPRCCSRVAKLYLPNGAIYFRCRKCYKLTYQSSNDSHSFDRLFRILASDTGTSVSVVKDILKKGW